MMITTMMILGFVCRREQQAAIQNHNVVQTLPSNRANQPLGKCVLPRTPRCSDNLFDSQRQLALPWGGEISDGNNQRDW